MNAGEWRVERAGMKVWHRGWRANGGIRWRTSGKSGAIRAGEVKE